LLLASNTRTSGPHTRPCHRARHQLSGSAIIRWITAAVVIIELVKYPRLSKYKFSAYGVVCIHAHNRPCNPTVSKFGSKCLYNTSRANAYKSN
jgi:hypothetical protein